MASSAVSILLGNLAKLLIEEPPLSPPTEKQNLYILCTGESGCGSSSFINSLIASSVPHKKTKTMYVRQSLSSCTKEVEWTLLTPVESTLPPALRSKYNLHIGDTPGFNFHCADEHSEYGSLIPDTDLTDREIIRMITESVCERNLPGGLPGRLGILVLCDKYRPRPSLRMVSEPASIGKALKHTIVVSTKWSLLSDNTHQNPGAESHWQGSPPVQSEDECTDRENGWEILRCMIMKVDSQDCYVASSLEKQPAITRYARALSNSFSMGNLKRNLKLESLSAIRMVDGEEKRKVTGATVNLAILNDSQNAQVNSLTVNTIGGNLVTTNNIIHNTTSHITYNITLQLPWIYHGGGQVRG